MWGKEAFCSLAFDFLPSLGVGQDGYRPECGFGTTLVSAMCLGARAQAVRNLAVSLQRIMDRQDPLRAGSPYLPGRFSKDVVHPLF